MAENSPRNFDLRDAWDNLKRRDIKQVALVAFFIGVVLHACVALAVLDDGRTAGSTSGGGQRAVPASATATATRPADRASCDEIRGTAYRSDTERQWFLTHCTSPP